MMKNFFFSEFVLGVLSILVCIGSKMVTLEDTLILVAYIIVCLCAILVIIIIARQPVADVSLSFKVSRI